MERSGELPGDPAPWFGVAVRCGCGVWVVSRCSELLLLLLRGKLRQGGWEPDPSAALQLRAKLTSGCSAAAGSVLCQNSPGGALHRAGAVPRGPWAVPVPAGSNVKGL